MFRNLPLSILVSLAAAHAQIPYRGGIHPTYVELLSPWSGPGSAQSNPAALSGTAKAYGHLGGVLLDGSAGYPVFQFAGDLPAGFSAGFGGFLNKTGDIDLGNAVHLEDILVSSLAFAWPLEPTAGYRLALGLSRSIHHFEAFGAAENRDAGWDLGFLYSFQPHAAAGRFQLGLVYQRLVRPSVELPDNRGSYFIPGQSDLAITWTSPANRWEGHLGIYRIPGADYRDFPGLLYWELGDLDNVETWGIQFAPIPWLAFKVETPFFSWLAAYGVVAKLAPLIGHPLRIETNVGMTNSDFPWVPEKTWGQGHAGEAPGLFVAVTVGAEV